MNEYRARNIWYFCAYFYTLNRITSENAPCARALSPLILIVTRLSITEMSAATSLLANVCH